jgi:hypothetical protein
MKPPWLANAGGPRQRCDWACLDLLRARSECDEWGKPVPAIPPGLSKVDRASGNADSDQVLDPGVGGWGPPSRGHAARPVERSLPAIHSGGFASWRSMTALNLRRSKCVALEVPVVYPYSCRKGNYISPLILKGNQKHMAQAICFFVLTICRQSEIVFFYALAGPQMARFQADSRRNFKSKKSS